jgi:hypothetical protein
MPNPRGIPAILPMRQPFRVASIMHNIAGLAIEPVTKHPKAVRKPGLEPSIARLINVDVATS